jgi:hypothetical protein
MDGPGVLDPGSRPRSRPLQPVPGTGGMTR